MIPDIIIDTVKLITSPPPFSERLSILTLVDKREKGTKQILPYYLRYLRDYVL